MSSKYDTTYYDNAYEDFKKQQKTSAENQKALTEADFKNRLTQAYISQRQAQRATDEALTKAGIRGGMTETSALKNALAYQNARSGLQTERANALRDIDQKADDNILAYKQTNDAAKNAYIEGREAEDRAVARENAAEKKQTDIQLMTTKYGAYNDVGQLQEALANTTDPNEQIIIQARMNYLNETNTAKQETNNLAYLESKYGGISDVDKLKTMLKNAPTVEEQTIIQNRINLLQDTSDSQKIDRYTAYYSRFYSTDDLKKELNKTTDPIKRMVINNRIGYLYAHNKGY